jgi:DNA-binding GntR family transcriptional regulator
MSLARELEVAEMTVQRAVNALKDEGLVYALPGRGTFVHKR